MRAVLSLLLFLALSGTALGGEPCAFDAVHPREVARNYSDFRGISFASTPAEVLRVAAELGYQPEASHYVGSTALVSAVNIWTGCDHVGIASFDRSGRVLRLSFKDRYFCAGPVFVRHFAEAAFERYDVKPVKERDDVCFQDVTCFKGVSGHGEHFLILRIGTTAELHARPPSVDASR